jgi:hypothetical protein
VEFLACFADQRRQARLDVHVHVFELDFPVELTALDFLGDLFEAFADVCQFLLRQNLDTAKLLGVGQRAFDVLALQPLVKRHALAELLHELVGFAAESSVPHGSLRSSAEF